MKKQKGITLIALIITIIVMLILVGVTINVAMNGGLIEKASRAKEGTKIANVKEQVVGLMVGQMDNKSRIPSGVLGTVQDGNDVLNVEAVEENGAIKIKLTKQGEQEPRYNFSLVDLKITGKVTIASNNPAPSGSQNPFTHYGDAYTKDNNKDDLLEVYVIEENVIKEFSIENSTGDVHDKEGNGGVNEYPYTIISKTDERLEGLAGLVEGGISSIGDDVFVIDINNLAEGGAIAFNQNYTEIIGYGYTLNTAVDWEAAFN